MSPIESVLEKYQISNINLINDYERLNYFFSK